MRVYWYQTKTPMLIAYVDLVNGPIGEPDRKPIKSVTEESP